MTAVVLGAFITVLGLLLAFVGAGIVEAVDLYIGAKLAARKRRRDRAVSRDAQTIECGPTRTT